MKDVYDVRLTGWRPGLKVLSLIDLVRGSAALTLTQAKALVDGLLDGRTHTLSFANLQDAHAFQAAANDLGVETVFESE
jgi:hypothetical protein